MTKIKPLSTLVLDQELYSIKQASAALGIGDDTIRKAVKNGELPSFLIGGRDPVHAGRGFGYRIRRADLQGWYFGEAGK